MTMLAMPLDDDLAAEAGAVFAGAGIDTPTAVRIFLRRAVEERGVPSWIAAAPVQEPDPFWSEENMAYLNRVRADWERGVNFAEHDLVEV